MAVTFTKTDLSYLLTQILMAETNTPPLSPHLAFGLRELAGTNNNTVPGQSTFGSADTPFATVTDPLLLNAQFGTSYTSTVPGPPGAFGVNVIDSQPRTISNLISDILRSRTFGLSFELDSYHGTIPGR